MTDFDIEYSDEAIFQLKGLDTQIDKRIVRKIESTRSDPRRFFVRLIGRTEFKLLAGDYRAIVEIEENQTVIIIRSLGHRKNIYK